MPTETSQSTATVLYETDNGRILCKQHLGASARMTGRDISGQIIRIVSTQDAADFQAAIGRAITCERCEYSA